MKEVLNAAHEYAKQYLGRGRVADYIPELSKADPMHLGAVITSADGEIYTAGDYKEKFTIQSISKVIALALALEEHGRDAVFKRVGTEATGDAFNSIVRLETNPAGLPSNPMINAGAISVCTFIEGKDADERINKLLTFASKMLGCEEVSISGEVYKSELLTGDRNRALAYLMRTNRVFGGDVNEHLEVYFQACSMLVNSENISYLGAVLANDGITPKTGTQIISSETARAVRAMMVTAGMYDASGRFALGIGAPAKSGVGGGILCAVRGKMGIGVFSPALDKEGNSLCAIKLLEYLSRELDLFVY